jgi:hypothetical protein
MTVPEGAERSEDGYYWLDGGDWKAVPEDDPKHPNNAGATPADAAGAEGAAAGTPANTSDDPLQDEQVKQAVSHDYPEIVAYADTHGAELSGEADPDAGANEGAETEHEGEA